MAIEWNENMITGVLEIDEDHKEWLRRFNEFDSAVANHRGSDVLDVALHFFEQYTEFHFPNEEWRASNLLSRTAEKNKAEHNLIRQKLAELKTKIRSEGVSMAEVMELKDEMEQWLIKHICETDVQVFSEIANS